MSTRERIAALNALSDLMKDPNALKIITAKGPELSAVLMEMAQNDKEVSRSAQKISLALTKFSLMDGMKVAGQKMSLRNVLMQLASGGEGSGKHHMGVYKTNLDILPPELQGLSGLELQKAAQAYVCVRALLSVDGVKYHEKKFHSKNLYSNTKPNSNTIDTLPR
jgi:hypothetical protein